MMTIACRRYLRMNFGVRMPSFERNQDTMGSSKTTPAASMTLMMKFMYSLMAMLFSIVGGAERGEETERRRQHHEVREGHAAQETERGEGDDGTDRPALAREQSGGNEGPDLVQDVREAQERAADDRHLHVQEELTERLEVLQRDRWLSGRGATR